MISFSLSKQDTEHPAPYYRDVMFAHRTEKVMSDYGNMLSAAEQKQAVQYRGFSSKAIDITSSYASRALHCSNTAGAAD